MIDGENLEHCLAQSSSSVNDHNYFGEIRPVEEVGRRHHTQRLRGKMGQDVLWELCISYTRLGVLI